MRRAACPGQVLQASSAVGEPQFRASVWTPSPASSGPRWTCVGSLAQSVARLVKLLAWQKPCHCHSEHGLAGRLCRDETGSAPLLQSSMRLASLQSPMLQYSLQSLHRLALKLPPPTASVFRPTQLESNAGSVAPLPILTSAHHCHLGGPAAGPAAAPAGGAAAPAKSKSAGAADVHAIYPPEHYRQQLLQLQWPPQPPSCEPDHAGVAVWWLR